MNPDGRVRCNMHEQIELDRGDCNFTIKSAHSCLGSSSSAMALGERGDALW